ncbi:hypothetical protein O3G_MSEX001959 [Manduca sexta]|uniref:C2H2-type domain-containing protein n=1 Tax=Manduca sexta TaxID=7130 RepID=A0A921YLZ5_MANSE|nr:hypothetical protein O3G_MSEX001959 [Manduca sexta]
MCSQPLIINVNRLLSQNMNVCSESKPAKAKEKVMSYEEKSVGSTPFFKCEACPFMALAEDDIKFHLFTVHPDLAKTNGLADNVQIPCPGCNSVFDAEETLRTHLRNHHKMGFKDVKKMIKSLVQIALKDAKLKKESTTNDQPAVEPLPRKINEMRIPQVIEIVPDVITSNNDLPRGVAYISMDELHKMSTPNFEKVDPKDIIQEASINIVYTNEVSTQYMNVSDASTNQQCSIVQMPSVTPDLISSIHPRKSTTDDSKSSSKDLDSATAQTKHSHKEGSEPQIIEKLGESCSIDGCHIRLKDEKNLAYHRKCHQNGQYMCPECSKMYLNTDALHTHLWKIHSVDLELPTCEICGFKTFKKHRLFNIHMKCHGKIKSHFCPECPRSFKNPNQLSKHKLVHKKDSTPVKCGICQREFRSEKRLKAHIAQVHEKRKPFQCCHCDYTAARKEELKLHLRSHTGNSILYCACSYSPD